MSCEDLRALAMTGASPLIPEYHGTMGTGPGNFRTIESDKLASQKKCSKWMATSLYEMIPQNSPSKDSTSRCFIHRFQIQPFSAFSFSKFHFDKKK